MPNRRRDFLGWLGASTLLAASGTPLRAQSAPDSSTNGSAASRPVDDTWDMSWVDRVKGEARAVFDSPDVSEGDALYRAIGWREDYRSVYGADSPLTAVLVLRHKAIPLAMGDAFWSRFKIGKDLKIKDSDHKRWAEANPIRTVPPGTPAKFASFSLEGFIASGGIVLACHLAFQSRVVPHYRKADKLTPEQAEAAARRDLVPGVILQPTGVFAVLRAQQAGCHFILAS